MPIHNFSRRSFLQAATAAVSVTHATSAPHRIPVGLELYSVRDELKQDLKGTLRGVAKMGYEGVEFYAPYFDWKPEYAKDVRKLLDELGMRCFSTHNDAKSFTPDSLPRAIELNQILGSKHIVMASAGKTGNLEGWKSVAKTLNAAAAKLKPLGLLTGFHNHHVEFITIEGRRPIDVLSENTQKAVTLQLDVGNALAGGADPVAFIQANPGRIRSMHCKDWSSDPSKEYKVLLGEGVAPWKEIFRVVQKTGGIEYYLVEQEGSSLSPMETAKRCLSAFRKLHAS